MVTGSQYGTSVDFGLRQENFIGEDGLAFYAGQSKHRRLLYMEPSGGKKMLVVAFVNNNSNFAGCSGATPKCRLEFRASVNNGLTWSQALLGSKPFLEIVGPKFDYSLYPDPNGNDIWVSYTDGVVATQLTGVDPQTFTNSVIQKLDLDPTSKSAWTPGLLERPKVPNSCADALHKDCVGQTAVGIQVTTGVARVWGYATESVNSGGRFFRYGYLVYKNISDFGNTGVQWTQKDVLSLSRTENQEFTAQVDEFGAVAKATFFPLGTNKIPVLITSKPRRDIDCHNIDIGSDAAPNPQGISLRVLRKIDDDNWRQQNGNPSQEVSTSFPYYYVATATCPGGDPVQQQRIAPPSGSYPMDFSAAALPDTVDPNKGRVVIAYQGGVDPTGASHDSQMRVATCTVTIQTAAQNGVGSTVTCPIVDQVIATGYGSGSVGFYQGVPWVAYSQPVGTTPSPLNIIKETAYNPPGTWTWTVQPNINYTNNASMPSVAPYIPTGGITTLSGYIPTVWSETGRQRIAFIEDSGGTTIGSVPKVSANAVQGYGWASNFGWVSLNCINKPAQDCTNLFGTGIGGVATGADMADAPGLAPSSATTFPIGGFGWSSNAGFLSFERRDSINNCHATLANCNDADPLTDDNDFGNPVGLPYNSYAPSTPATIVTVAGVNQVNITTGTCADFPDGSYVAISDVPATKPVHFALVSTCNGGSGIVDIHTTPNSIYPNGTTGLRMYKVSPNVALAKYDTASQHVYGWARFINLCNYDATTQRCKDKDAGWVRLRGYYTTGAGSSDTFGYTAGNPTIMLDDGTAFTSGSGIAQIGSETFRFTCTGLCLTLSIQEAGGLKNSYGQTTVYNVTGKEYGLDAFWTGDHYEFAGWAWSNDYGWIRFNPLIFIGFSWLETLFGNVYSAGQVDSSGNLIAGYGDIQLPNAEDLNGQRFTTCGVSGTEPCYVSTYRIDAVGVIDPLLTFAGTGQPVNGPGSAAGIINAGSGTCGSGANEQFCKLQGDTTALQSYLSRNGVSNVRFPTVGATTASYRNALGKLDVSGLTTIVSQYAGHCTNVVSPSKSYTCYFPLDKNRFGSMVYKTDLDSNQNPVNWELTELAGWKNGSWSTTDTPKLPLNALTVPQTNEKAPLRSQVVHVQGDLTIDGGEALWSSTGGNLDSGATGTISVSGVTGTMPTSTVRVGNTTGNTYPSCSGCALVVNPGASNEEYFSYTGYAASVFTGVRRIKACGGSCPSHAAGEKVRFVWRLPYVSNDPENIAQSATVVVDGDLKINYNIIAADPKNDADLVGGTAPNTIRDLPTIAFVVKGNVTIDPQVNKLTAAFIVTSRDSTKTPNTPGCGTQYSGNCGGLFQTGNDNVSTICSSAQPKCRPLSITGLLFAREFNFQRIGNLQDNQHPGEQVIADERLFLNPPPGMEDVTKALPNPQRTLP